MRIFINKEPVEVEKQATLGQVAIQLKLPSQGVAVAINYEVVPRNEWDTYILQEDVELMIVQAVSGG